MAEIEILEAVTAKGYVVIITLSVVEGYKVIVEKRDSTSVAQAARNRLADSILAVWAQIRSAK